MNDNAQNAGALLGSEGLLDLYRTVPVCNASGRRGLMQRGAIAVVVPPVTGGRP